MKLYGHPISTCTRKALMLLEERHAKADFVLVDLMKGEHKGPAHLERQPFGQIPVLEDGDLRLYESRAILRYLDETLPGAALTPRDPKGRAMMEQWISVETSNFTPHAMGILYELMFGPMMRGTQPDMAKVEESSAKLANTADILDKQLAQGPHLLGDSFSLADICYMPYIEYVVQTSAKDVLLSRPNVAAWWGRISGRPSWQKAIGKG
ncbi:MAG: glutathione S-transferase N-terminal domain-containing protein [Polyangiaceae bacterium]|nr:glutathione S-transferase N-terminal domain-containing protein [Polyangiaceae bacterium]